jgi:hypothetical protein
MPHAQCPFAHLGDHFMPQPRNPNYAVPLDYSWHDLKVRAEDVMREARRIVESTRMVLAHSQQIRANLCEPDKPAGTG